MEDDTRHVAWVSIDTYDRHGRLVSSVLGARTLQDGQEGMQVLCTILDHLPPNYRQMSYDEVVEALANEDRPTSFTWEQLSIW